MHHAATIPSPAKSPALSHEALRRHPNATEAIRELKDRAACGGITKNSVKCKNIFFKKLFTVQIFIEVFLKFKNTFVKGILAFKVLNCF